jgi:hypothetical protein
MPTAPTYTESDDEVPEGIQTPTNEEDANVNGESCAGDLRTGPNATA